MTIKEILLYLHSKHNGDWDEIYNAIKNKEKVNEDDVMEFCNKNEIDYITLVEENYPTRFKCAVRPPFTIFYKGDFSLLNRFDDSVSMVLNDESSPNNIIFNNIISGAIEKKVFVFMIDDNIDTFLVKRIINNGGRVIGILCRGFNNSLSKTEKNALDLISEKNLVISEFNAETKVDCRLEAQRIFALSPTALIGALHESKYTIELLSYLMAYGVDIFCVPLSMDSDCMNNSLIADGAYVAQNHEDLLDI